VGSGTRPRIDDGLLGITVAGASRGRGSHGNLPQRPWREWTASSFELEAGDPVHVGIDGEAATLEPPLGFVIRHGVLRVRIAPRHPGASPSAMLPESFSGTARALSQIAVERDPAAREPARTSSSEPTTKET
jgi:hypothetical protein